MALPALAGAGAAAGKLAGAAGGFVKGRVAGAVLGSKRGRRLLLWLLALTIGFPLLLAMAIASAPSWFLERFLTGETAVQGSVIHAAAVPAGAREFIPMYEDAATQFGVNPFLLLAVHEDETNFGHSDLPGVRTGRNQAGCCAGPMQFLIEGGDNPLAGGIGGTWWGYRNAHEEAELPRPGGYVGRFEPHPNVYDSYDSIYAAAMYFEALGAGPELDQRTFEALTRYKGTPPASIPYAQADYDRALELARRSKEAFDAELVKGPGPAPSGGRLGWPLPAPSGLENVISPFGMRWGRPHEGIDITAAPETPIFAAADGEVTTKEWLGGYGWFTCITHARGYSTCYAHQSRFGPVPLGGRIRRGQLVGYVGCTGRCFGPHLHFEVRYLDRPKDPMPFLRP